MTLYTLNIMSLINRSISLLYNIIIVVHKSTLLMTSYTYETRGSCGETKVNISLRRKINIYV